MNIQYVENPNPIKLSHKEQEIYDEILDTLEGLMFGKWATQRGQVANTLIYEKDVIIDRAGTGPIPLTITVKGSKREHNKNKYLFGFTYGELKTFRKTETHRVTRLHLFVYLNGWPKKKDFEWAKTFEPYSFWNSYLGFKNTLRHELTHAKDPTKKRIGTQAIATGGTSAYSNEFGFGTYINDPKRAEFRSHLSEWDNLTSEIQFVYANRNLNEYYKDVWEKIRDSWCSRVLNHKGRKNFNKRFIRYMESGEGFVPDQLARNLVHNKNFATVDDDEIESIIDFYEGQHKKYWEQVYFAQLDKFRKEGGRKPKPKTKFTKKERNRIRAYRKDNYTDMINAIYSLFSKKGLLDPSICISDDAQYERISDKKAAILMRSVHKPKNQMIIQALLQRFESLED
tara:strand:+ start:1446 stop:2639 length:1194 start_codon:yes stop_codon:yes gene_type:complete